MTHSSSRLAVGMSSLKRAPTLLSSSSSDWEPSDTRLASDVAIALGAWGPDTPHYISGNMISTIGSAYNSASDENIDLYLGAEVSGINPLWYDGDILTF